MAKVNVVGDAMVITSTMKYSEIETIKKFRPDALTLKGGEDGKEPIFSISIGDESDISKYGVCFSGKTRDENGFATLTIGVCAGVENLKDTIADHFGRALVNISKLEESLPAVLEEIKAEKERVLEYIEIA